MKIDFLPEEKAAEQSLKNLFASVISKVKKPIHKNEAEIVNFDLQSAINATFKIPFSEIPEFSFDSKTSSFSCPTGQYIFLIKKIKNNF